MRHAFDDALAKAERDVTDPPAPPPSFAAALPVSDAPAPTGHHSLWESAAEWTPEADPPPPRPQAAPLPPPPRPSARAEDIAAELGLGRLSTPAQLARARRVFMWENHPDRRADLDGDLANRRVALANMLLDQELERLGRRRASR